MSLSSYLFERHQCLTHKLQERMSTLRAAYHRMQNRAAQRPGLCDQLEPRMMMSATPITYVDASGDTVTITLKGDGDLVVVGNNGNADITSITLSGTTIKSALTISVTNADKTAAKTTTIEKIDLGTGSLGTLNAAGVDIIGDHDVDNGGIVGGADSVIRILTIHDLNNDSAIILDGADAKSSTKITANNISASAEITLGNEISYATFNSFTNSTLTTDSIGTLTIKGNFSGTLKLDGNPNTKYNTLGTATISGDIGALSDFDIGGSVGSFKANSLIDSKFAATGWVGTINIAHDMTWTTVGMGSLSARGINTLTVGGDYNYNGIVGGNVADAKLYTLKNMTVGGTLTNGFTLSNGHISSIKAGAFGAGTLDVQNGTIGKLISVANVSNLKVYAIGVTTVDISGAADQLDVYVGSTTTQNKAVISSFTVDGALTHSSIQNIDDATTYGGIGTLTVGSMSSFNIDLDSDRINKLIVKGNIDTCILNVNSIGTFSAGEIDSTDLNMGAAAIPDGKQALDALTVTGAITGSNFIAASGGAGNISGGTLTNSKFEFVQGTVKSVTSTSSQTGGTVKAKKLGSWNVKTNLDSTIATLADAASPSESPKLSALGSLTVGGNMVSAVINANKGYAGNISVGTFDDAAISFVDGTINSITSKGTTNKLTLTAKAVNKKWTIGGDMTDSLVTLGETAISGSYALTDLIVTGDIKGTAITMKNGGIRTISARSITNSSEIKAETGRINSIVTTTGNVANSTIQARTIGTWTVAGNLDTVTATIGTADVTNKTYSLEKLTVYGNMTDTKIDADYGAANYIYAKSISGGEIIFKAGSIRSVYVDGSMTSSDNTKVQLQATSIGTWTVKGDLTKSKAVFDDDNSKEEFALGTLTVTGAMTDVDLSAAHDGAKSITAGSISGGTLNYANAAIGTLKSNGNMSGMTMTVERVDNWLVYGNLSATNANIGNDTTDNAGSGSNPLTIVVGYMYVSGAIDQLDLYADGSIDYIQAKKLTNSTIMAGYVNSGGNYVYDKDEEIFNLWITGDGEGSFTGNTINASWIGAFGVYDPSASAVTAKMMQYLKVTQYNNGSTTKFEAGGSRNSDWFDSTPTAPAGALDGLTLNWV